MNEFESLLAILRKIETVDAISSVDVIQNSPNWLAQKLRLYPSSSLASKLSCLQYQLEEYVSGKAVDIEDHFLNFGVGKADLTYLINGEYLFVDVTTSKDERNLTNKTIGIRSQVRKVNNSRAEVRVIPITKTLEEPTKFWKRNSEDKCDILFKTLLNTKSEIKEEIITGICHNIYPKYIQTLLSSKSKSEEMQGHLSYDITTHDTDIMTNDSRVLEQMSDMIELLKGYDKRSPLRVPIPRQDSNMANLEPDKEDPINIALHYIVTNTDSLKPNTLYVIGVDNAGDCEKMSEQNLSEKEVDHLIKYKEDGITNLQVVTAKNARPCISFVLGDEVATTLQGKKYYKHFTLGTNIISSNFGSQHLDHRVRVDREKRYKPVTLLEAAKSVKEHNNLVDELSHDYKVSTFVKKIATISNNESNKEWFKFWSGAYQDSPLKSMGFYVASILYSYSRTISIALSEKTPKHRFRLVMNPEEDCYIAISTSKRINNVTDICASFLCDNIKLKSNDRSRNRTVTLSQREVTWWIKLMPTLLAKYSVDAQHNLTLSKDDKLRQIKRRDLVEFLLMHLSTRQTDSIIQGQLRYTMAGLYSPLTSKFGAIEKIKGLVIKGPHMMTYFLRMCKLHAISFLTKSGMTPNIEIHEDSPIAVAVPFQSTPVVSYPQYIDAIFDSSMFNKIKDRKVESQAIDWLNLVETDDEFNRVKVSSPELVKGYTDETSTFIDSIIADPTVLSRDVSSAKSYLLTAAVEMDRTLAGTKEKFKWNMLGMFIIAIKQSRGRTLVEETENINNSLSYLMNESLSTIMSSTGSVEKGPVTKERQSIRKSTALAWELVAEHSKNPTMKKVGRNLYNIASEFPTLHQSILSSSLNIILHNGTAPIVSRTETKDQKDSYREFSPMNAIGVISCRAAERLIYQALPMYPTDRMADTDPEHTLYIAVKETERTNRNIYISADCSRFGPNQIMCKSRVVAFSLCFTHRKQDIYITNTTYELLAESTRLMENKLAKVPYELYNFIIKSGGLQRIKRHNPDSVYGRLASMVMETYKTTKMPNYMLQKFGMYQGTLGMFSSIASTMLHDTLIDVVKDFSICNVPRALVTNDDSLLIFPEVTMNIKDTSSILLNTLYKILYVGGQILNKFKTVPTTKIAEFHSTFALPRGLICPELKQLFAGIQISSGESLYKDSRHAIEQAVSAVRNGVSLFSATSLAVILTTVYCDQYNRWLSFKNNGFRLSQMGGPCEINILGEMFLPNFSDMKYMNKLEIPIDVQTGFLTNTMISESVNEIVEATSVNVKMITRSTYRSLRGIKETNWVAETPFFPLSGSCTVGHLYSTMSYGLFRTDREKNLPETLVRYARNQVSRKEENIWVSDNTLTYSILGKDRISYDDLDGISTESIVKEINTLSKKTQNNVYYNTIYIGYRNIVDAGEQLSGNLPTIGSLLRESTNRVFSDVVHPTRVISNAGGNRVITPLLVAKSSGDEELSNAIAKEDREIMLDGTFERLKDKFNMAMSLSTVSNKLNHFRTGPMKLIDVSPKYTKIEEAIIKVASNTIRGISNTSPFAIALASVARTTFIPDAPDDNLISNIETLAVMTRSGTLRNGVKMSIPPIALYQTFIKLEKSWWTIGSVRWKASKIKKKKSMFSIGKVEQGVVVTKFSVLNGLRKYDHTIFCNVTSLRLGEWDTFLSGYVDNNINLIAGQTYYFDSDSVTIISHTTPIPGKTIVSNTGLLYFDYDNVKIPLIYDRRHAKLDEVVEYVNTNRQADKADLEVYCSYANKMFDDFMVTDLKGKQFDMSYAKMIFSRYGGGDIVKDLEENVFCPVMHDNMKSEYILARSRMLAWLSENKDAVFGSDFDNDEYPFYEFDDNIEANIPIEFIDDSDEDFEGPAPELDEAAVDVLDYFNNGFDPSDFL